MVKTFHHLADNKVNANRENWMLSPPFHNNLIPTEEASNNMEKRFEKFWDEPMKCFLDECSIQNYSIITP
jgi:hypothetical protein